jgi:hypothetical protein
MVSVESQKPLCPVCHQSDQVKTTQAAYDSGVARCAPPDLPTKHVRMMPYILFSVIFLGFCAALIFILIGSESNISIVVQSIIIALAVISILTALSLSYYAFQRVVAGDAAASERFPAWDRAMAVWRSLYYCKRDDVVFDPKSNTLITEDQLAALRSMEKDVAEVVTANITQRQSVSGA